MNRLFDTHVFLGLAMMENIHVCMFMVAKGDKLSEAVCPICGETSSGLGSDMV